MGSEKLLVKDKINTKYTFKKLCIFALLLDYIEFKNNGNIV